MNWFAILFVVVINQALGFVWYACLFGKVWMASAGRTPEQVHASNLPHIVTFIAGFLMAVGLSCLIRNQSANTPLKGAKVGLMSWLAFVGPVIAMHYMFLGYGWTTVAIDAFEQLVGMLVMGALLAAWPKK